MNIVNNVPYLLDKNYFYKKEIRRSLSLVGFSKERIEEFITTRTDEQIKQIVHILIKEDQAD